MDTRHPLVAAGVGWESWCPAGEGGAPPQHQQPAACTQPVHACVTEHAVCVHALQEPPGYKLSEHLLQRYLSNAELVR
jgi:hypothetical protein